MAAIMSLRKTEDTITVISRNSREYLDRTMTSHSQEMASGWPLLAIEKNYATNPPPQKGWYKIYRLFSL